MKGLNIGQKLTFLFLIMALIVVITGSVGIFSLHKVGLTIQNVLIKGSIQSNQVVFMKTALQECRVHLLEASATEKLEDFESAKADFGFKRDRFNSYVNLVLNGNQKLGLPAVTKGSPLEEHISIVAQKFSSFSASADKLLTLKVRMIRSGKASGSLVNGILTVIKTELPERTDQVTTAVDELLVNVNSMMQKANATATSIQHTAQLILVVVIFGAILIAIVFGTLVSKNIVIRVKEMATASNRLANGDLAVVVKTTGHDEISILGTAMNKMAATIKDLIEKTESRNIVLTEWHSNELWFKSGLNDLNNILRGDQQTEELADKALSFMIGYVAAGVGVIYQFEDKDETLQVIATYAITGSDRLKGRLHPGEGLAGQSAKERKILRIDSVPQDYLPIASALGGADPLNIVVMPIMYNDKLAGVLEMGSFKPFEDKDISFLSQATDGIAIAMKVNRSRQLVNDLLEQTQAQTEELRMQQEELQQSNEELSERARMLSEQRKRA